MAWALVIIESYVQLVQAVTRSIAEMTFCFNKNKGNGFKLPAKEIFEVTKRSKEANIKQ